MYVWQFSPQADSFFTRQLEMMVTTQSLKGNIGTYDGKQTLHQLQIHFTV